MFLNWSKDLWGDSGATAEARSSVVGFAYLNNICTQNRYSIVEEAGGFTTATVYKIFNLK